jgi:hypothetical protein
LFASFWPDFIGSNCLGNCSVFPSRAVFLNNKQEKVPFELVGIESTTQLCKNIEERGKMRQFLEIALLNVSFHMVIVLMFITHYVFAGSSGWG